MDARLKNENEAYRGLLCGHLSQMTWMLQKMSPEQWDWTPDQAAPTVRILAAHTWQWLICDRHHINEPDASQHPRIPEPPQDTNAMCDALQAETEEWRTLLMALTPEQLMEERRQFNDAEAMLNVRWFVYHIIQNTIYKNGQLSTLFYALGLDGTEPYDAPFPNPIYAEVFGPSWGG